MKLTDVYSKIFADKNKILAIFSHPDDLELYCAGTIAKLIKDGKEVRSVKMTFGNKGSRQEKVSEEELRKLREDEDKAAMKVLGIKEENNVYLNFNDGEIENNLQTIEALAKQIREFKPDLIITHNPENIIIRFDKDVNWVNHRDHRNTGKSVIDAAYPYSRDLLFFPEQLKDGKLSSHIVTEFLLVDYYDHEDTIAIDITEYVNEKNESLSKHSSQYSLEKAKETTDFFTKLDESGRRYERFRYVVTD